MAAAYAARRFDVVVYGATGFTGRLVAEYLTKYPAAQLRWAIAGRSQHALNEVKAALDTDVDVVLANARDPSSLDALAKSTRVVISTVGPFAKYGEGLVAACAANGTNYVDSTGESPWVASMIQKYDEDARANGSLIVPMCGFDSIPSDVGTLYLVNHIRESMNASTKQVTSCVAMKGGASGGTVHSALNLIEDKALSKGMNNPHLMCQPRTELDPKTVVAKTRPAFGVSWDSDLKVWRAPFLMSVVNEQAVRRSAYIAAQRGEPYSTGVFQYREHHASKSFIKAFFIMFFLGFGGLIALLGPARNLIRRFFPAGQGPTKAQREGGFMRVRMVGVTDEAKPRKAILEIAGKGDPGYKLTSQMLAEAALTIAKNRDECPGRAGGIYTPATGLGLALARRLHDSGITFTVSPVSRL